jgi:hypothetical protein
MAIKTGDIVGLSIGGGLLLIGGYLLYSQWEENKLIGEFMDKVARCENEFRNAMDRGDYEAAQTINDFYSSLMNEEEEVINRKGFWDKLKEACWAMGFLVGMGIAFYIIKIINDRWGKPPGGFKCGFCNRTFSTTDALDSHLKTEHNFSFDEGKVSWAESAYRGLVGWVKGMLSLVSGVEEFVLSKPWEALPQWVYIVIAIAALVLLAVLWWVPGIGEALATIGAMAAVAA